MTTTAKGVTPEMVEAGAKACRDITFNALTMDECRDAVRAALEAALSVSSGGLAVKALRQVVFDALDLSDELRNECTDAVVAALTALDRTTLPAAEGEKAVAKIDALTLAGRKMANILFNIEQRAGLPIEDFSVVKKTREEWYRALASHSLIESNVNDTAKDLLASLDPNALNPEQFNAWHALDTALSNGAQ